MSTNQRQSQRKQSFKKGISKDGARRGREEKNINIRKNKRLEQMQKRRNIRATPKPDVKTPANAPVKAACVCEL